MSARVLFFGATAEIVGKRDIDIAVSDGFTTDAALKEILNRFPGLISHKLHISINQQYSTGNEIIHDGDELAVFTAVSGG